MSPDPRIGEKAGPYRELATPERLAKFAQAVGSRASGVAAPTFLTVCRQGEFDLLMKFGVKLTQVLHGEQEYEYAGPVRAGEVLSYETRLASAYEKKGASAPMQFLVFETQVAAGEGPASRPAGTARTTIIVRGRKGDPA